LSRRAVTAVVLLISAAIALSSCALQTEMSPEIFLERLAEADKTLSVDFDGRYYSGDRCYCFVSDGGGTEYVLSMQTCADGSVQSVSLASTAVDRTAAFISLAGTVTSVYSPQEDIKAIVSALFLDGKVGERCKYYNTRRYVYSSASSENGLYFSIDDLRLGERSTPALTLGDLSGYLNRSKPSAQ